MKHHVSHGPEHIISALKLLKEQTTVVQDIIKPLIQRGACHANTENILSSLLLNFPAAFRRLIFWLRRIGWRIISLHTNGASSAGCRFGAHHPHGAYPGACTRRIVSHLIFQKIDFQYYFGTSAYPGA